MYSLAYIAEVESNSKRRNIMNRVQKMACFNLFVAAVSLGMSAGAAVIIGLIGGVQKAWLGFSFMGLCGLIALGPIIFRKDASEDKVPFDERDLLIQKKASLAGYNASYGFFVAVCMVIWSVVGMKGTIPVLVLPLMVCGGLCTLMFTQSLTLLVQYKRGRKGEVQ